MTQDYASDRYPDFRSRMLASSGNVLLPGAFSSALGGLAGNTLLPGDDAASAGLAGRSLTAMLDGSLSLQRSGENGPEVSVGLGAGLASAGGAAGSPLLAAISPATQGANTLTGGLLSGAAGSLAPNAPLGAATAPLASGGAAGPLVTASAGGVNVAGQPLVSLGGASVLTNVGSAAGGAMSGAGSLVSGVNPGSGAANVVNAAAGEVASAASGATGSPAPVSGLGGLTGVLPGLRR